MDIKDNQGTFNIPTQKAVLIVPDIGQDLDLC